MTYISIINFYTYTDRVRFKNHLVKILSFYIDEAIFIFYKSIWIMDNSLFEWNTRNWWKNFWAGHCPLGRWYYLVVTLPGPFRARARCGNIHYRLWRLFSIFTKQIAQHFWDQPSFICSEIREIFRFSALHLKKHNLSLGYLILVKLLA